MKGYLVTELLFTQAIGQMQQGQQKEARDLFWQVLQQQGDHALAHHYYGLMSIILGLYDGADVHMNQAFTALSHNREICGNQLKIAWLANKQGNFELGRSLLEHGQKTLPNDTIFAVNLAKLYLLNNKPEEAFNLLSHIPANEDFHCHYYRGISAQFLNDNETAEQSFSKALRIMPLHEGAPSAPQSGQEAIKLLICFGPESLTIRPVIVNDDIACSFGGHFDTNALLQNGNFNITRLFLSDSAACQEALQNLNEYDVVINALADAEVIAGSLKILQKALKKHKITAINPPQQTLKTSREDVYHRLKQIKGLSMVKTWQLEVSLDLELAKKQFQDIERPYLLRPLGSSTGIGLERIDDISDIEGILPDLLGQTFNICPFVDFASSDALYRKYRVFVIDGKILPEHCVASNHWNVHSSSRLNIMLEQAQLQQEEKDFVEDFNAVLTKQQQQVILKIAKALKLDYFGIDFTIGEDGELFVFEANSGMRINSDYVKGFPYLSAPIENIRQAFQTMLHKRCK